MKYQSTRNKSPVINGTEAILLGTAPDGGLYVPIEFPQLTLTKKAIKDMGLQSLGTEILNAWLGDEVPRNTLRQIANKALDFNIPLKQVGKHEILELFHGPTMAFKDVAARCLAGLMEHVLSKRKQDRTIIVATSGDTGGAVAQAFENSKQVRVVVLFPSGGVSQVQYEQLTNVASNVMPLEITGDFDECQKIVKKALQDPALQSVHLSTANSISIGRLIPQIIYYYWAWAHSAMERPIFVIPSGNYGNLTALLWAKNMGLPVQTIVAAVNANKVTERYATTGVYKPKQTIKTIANAMDIGDPSNFERVLYNFKNDWAAFGQLIRVTSVSDKEIIETIRSSYQETGYVFDPHTAVSVRACQKLDIDQSILVATASPLKFIDTMQIADIRLESPHPRTAMPSKVVKSSSAYSEVRKHIQNWR